MKRKHPRGKSRAPRLAPEIERHYGTVAEKSRLLAQAGRLEFHRTQEIISRYLPKKPAVILDVGGAAGIHACWLAKLGHAVHLVDPVPLHIAQAWQASAAQPNSPLASISLGDARRLNFADKCADCILLLGPLYHLTGRRDRLKSLREAFRALKPRGLLFAAAISRFASALHGLFRNRVRDPNFVKIVERDLKEGQHRNPTGRPEYFTTAFFHHPDELRREIQDAGFDLKNVLGVEGPGWMLPDFESFWNDPAARARLLKVVRAVETEPTLLGQSAHLLAVARKPA
jgi:ubiquinone/menaquinone biosynthesis C-methylase UbiE